MKYLVSQDQKAFFKRQRYVLLEDFFPADSLLAANAKYPRLSIDCPRIEQLYTQSRDAWRSVPEVEALVKAPSVVRVLHQLTDEPHLFLGADQRFPSPLSFSPIEKLDRKASFSYEKLISRPRPIHSLFSFQGIACGVILRLEGTPLPAEERTTILQQMAVGDALFVRPEATIDFSLLLTVCGAYLLTVYLRPNTVYIRSPLDPSEQWLKQFGYTFGDRLTASYHPLVYPVRKK